MDQYETEEQQVEALKKWWHENGGAIVMGLVLGLGGVFGWRAWVDYQHRLAGEASEIFESVIHEVDQKALTQVQASVEKINRNYSGTHYTGLAALALARAQYEDGKTVEAEGTLLTALHDIQHGSLRQIVVLRLARLMIAQSKWDEAAQLLERNPAGPGFKAEYAALRGDIALGRKDATTARAAYAEAIVGGAANATLLQMKLDQLGTSKPPAQGPSS